MQLGSVTNERIGGTSQVKRARRRWYRVRVQTDEGAYVGSLRLEPGCSALREMIDDDRAYLALWMASEEGSQVDEEFLALHKSAIRYVVVLGADDRPFKDLD